MPPQSVSMDDLDDMCGFGALPTAKSAGTVLVYQILLQLLPGVSFTLADNLLAVTTAIITTPMIITQEKL